MDVIDHDQIIFWKYTEYSINNPVSDFCCVFHPNNEKKRWRQEMEKAAIITVLMGTAMSALSGIKDSVADTKFYYHCEDDCSRSTSYYRFSRKIKGYG